MLLSASFITTFMTIHLHTSKAVGKLEAINRRPTSGPGNHSVQARSDWEAVSARCFVTVNTSSTCECGNTLSTCCCCWYMTVDSPTFLETPEDLTASDFVKAVRRFYNYRSCRPLQTGLLSELETDLFEDVIHRFFRVPLTVAQEAVTLQPNISIQFWSGVIATMTTYHRSWRSSVINNSGDTWPVFAHRIVDLSSNSEIPTQIVQTESILEIAATTSWTIGLLSPFNNSDLQTNTTGYFLKVTFPLFLLPDSFRRLDSKTEYSLFCIMLPQGENYWSEHDCQLAKIINVGHGIVTCHCRKFGMLTFVLAHIRNSLGETSMPATNTVAVDITTTNDPILTISTSELSTEPDLSTATESLTTPAQTVTSTMTTASPFSTTVEITERPGDPYTVLEYYANVTNFEQYPVQAINATLEAVTELAQHPPIRFSAIEDAVDIIDLYMHANFTDSSVNDDPWFGLTLDAVDLIVTICDAILGLDLSGEIESPQSTQQGNEVATLVLDTLEKLHTIAPPGEEAKEIFKDYISVYINAFIVNSTSEFQSISATLKLVVTVEEIFPNHTMDAYFSKYSLDEIFMGVSRLELNEEALRHEFNDFVQSLPPNTNAVFSYSLMALQKFRICKFGDPLEMPKRNARRTGSVLVSAAIQNTSRSHKEMVSITHKVDNLFKGRISGRKEHRCVYLDYKKSLHDPNVSARWSTEGCFLNHKNSTWKEGTIVECVCNHLTPFTMLLDLCGSIVSGDNLDDSSYYKALEPTIVTMASLSVSIICCFVIACHLLWAVWQKFIGLTPRNFTRLNLVLSIFLAHTSFLLTYIALEGESETGCLIMALICHWLMLVVFAWMGIEAYRMFLPTLKSKFWTATEENKVIPGDNYRGFRWKAWCIAWMLPLSLPFIAGLSHIDSMENSFKGNAYDVEERWCWLDPDHVVFAAVTFLVPITVVSACNILVLTVYIRHRINTQQKITIQRTLRQDSPQRLSIINLVGTTGLLGGTWLLGYFLLFVCSVDDNIKIGLGCLYIVLSAAQGVFILAVHIRGTVAGSFRKRERVTKRAVIKHKSNDSNDFLGPDRMALTLASSLSHGQQSNETILTEIDSVLPENASEGVSKNSGTRVFLINSEREEESSLPETTIM
ncbi:uncharacterized protein LOC129583736 isoform X2 [Paramacrobiotus metropolitanus]|uniref:uncharacterized protein LOC129583736 isoform X2 n=1 Tax=Paramacrobiotus metropolitanus TaxID=2943436 RepID=UPI002445FBB8|nr:uncharacterized protein LOC129583736 isoform X2 [Paramacrobiotus metropolitanus]